MDALILLIELAIGVFMIASLWITFSKAGKPGWAAIVPIYNLYIMTQIAGKPGWWVLLFFIPLVNIVLTFIVYIEIAHKFGKSTAFGVGMVLLSFIFFPILALSDAQYTG